PDGTGTTGRGTSGTEGTRPSETPDTQRGAEGTLSDQTTIGTKTVAEWRALPREQFAMEMSTYLTTLDERLQSADESVRTELTRKRDDLKKSLTDLRATTSTTWEDTRRKVLEGIREIETRLERR
ncbi:MAG TPA: hypothetical protein VK081_08980, partial [Planctomycetota bacterium]|nr:hypothetical protein [Planctomycetota bacterium]